MSLKIRPVAPAELPEFFRANAASFSDEWNPAELELEQTLMETERMVTAEDDGTLVGGGAARRKWAFRAGLLLQEAI